MLSNRPLVKNAAILTLAGVFSRFLGFLYRIFLSNLIGANGIGAFQLVIPVYILFVAFSSGGIQIAMSRFIAESWHDLAKRKYILYSGIIITAVLSVNFAFILFFSADFLAKNFIHYPAAATLFRMIAFCVPMTSIHACITGYYLGCQNTVVPAIMQIFEQLFKVVAISVVMIAVSNGYIFIGLTSFSPAIPAVIALLFSELAGSIILFFSIKKELPENIWPFSPDVLRETKKILSVSYILTANKVVLNILQSIEATLIPAMLIKYGVSESDALSEYGVLIGMALPVVAFPSALIGSIVLVIMPVVAQATAEGEIKSTHRTTILSSRISVELGIICLAGFLLTGNVIGTVLFGNPLAGTYIRCLCWMCPFLYLQITLGGILHGMGKTGVTFFHNLASISIRLIAILWLMPQIGISGYFYGIVVSMLLTVVLHGYVVLKSMR